VNYSITVPQRNGLSKREVLKGLNFKIFASYLIPSIYTLLNPTKISGDRYSALYGWIHFLVAAGTEAGKKDSAVKQNTRLTSTSFGSVC